MTFPNHSVHYASQATHSQMEHAMPVQERAMAQMAPTASQLTNALKEHLVSQRHHAQSVKLDMEHQTACNAQETSIVTVQHSAKYTMSVNKL